MTDFEKASLIYLAHCAAMLTDIASGTPSDDGVIWRSDKAEELRSELRKKLSAKTLAFLGDTSNRRAK